MINKVQIVGRLVDAPKLKYTPNGKPVANFNLASTRPYKDKVTGKKPTDFPGVVVWGPDAEFIANNGKKGAMIALSGRVETRNYDHAQYPIKVYVTEINAEEIQLLDWEDNGQGGQSNQGQSNNNQGGGSYGGGNYGNNNNNNQSGYGNNNQSGGYNQGGQGSNSGYGGNGQSYGGNNQGYGSNQGGGYGQGGDHMPGEKTIDINDDDLPF
jgi:single-strand DNA-binding protein